MFLVSSSPLETQKYLDAILWYVTMPVENKELFNKLQGLIIFGVRLDPYIAQGSRGLGEKSI